MRAIPGRPAETLALAILSAAVPIADALAADLAVTAVNVRSGDGVVRFCLAGEAERAGFPDCLNVPRERRLTVPARAGAVTATFHGVPPGLWAVSVYHDANDNGTLDKNLLGIPREGAGASRDPRNRLGPPSFDQAEMRIGPEGGAIAVSLVYP